MRKLTKTLALILAIILLLAGCGAKEASQKEISVKLQFDTSAVEYEGKLTGKAFEAKVKDGTNLFDATKEILESNGIELRYESGVTTFITGIGDLNMGDFAQTDGWLYTVNGEEIWDESTKIILNDGDVITWKFMIW